MWQRFTERARRVVLLGQEEAGKMNSSHVGTEHLLLGLIRENEGVAAQVLHKMGVSLERVRLEIEDEVEPSEEGVSSEPKLTPRAKRALELAADEARRMHHNSIGTEHLLLALLREKDGVAANVLRKLGLNLEETRRQVLEYLGPEAPPSGPSNPHAMTSHIIGKIGTTSEKTDWILPLLVRLLPPELRAMGQQLRQLNRAKDAAILVDDYETAAKLHDEVRELEKRMEEFADQWELAMEEPTPSANFDFTPAMIENLITQMETAIEALESSDAEKIAEVKRNLQALKSDLRGGNAEK